MSQHDDDDLVGELTWAIAAGARTAVLTPEDEEAADEALRRLGRERMMGMWRAALDATGDVVRDELARDELDEETAHKAPLAGWAARVVGDGKRGPLN